MPQKRDGYEDAMGSVFDFIFTESQKPPNKVKPMKVTGVDGSSEMVDAITAVLENPLLFVNKTTTEAFKGAIDVDLAGVNVGKRPFDNIKVNLQDIPTLLKNPGEYIDGQFKKIEGIRKMNRAAWAGEEMNGILGYMWAKQNGLDPETAEAMMAAGRIGRVDDYSKKPTGTRTIESTIGMKVRNEKLVNKYFSPRAKSLTQQEFTTMFGSVLSSGQLKDRWNKYTGFAAKARDAYQKQDPAEKEAELNKLYMDRDLYTLLEKTNLSEKAVAAKQSGDVKKAEKYVKAGNYIDNVYDLERSKTYRNKQKETLKNYSGTIESLRRSNDPDKDTKIKEIKLKMGDVKKDISYSRLEELAGNLGKYEGMYYSAKELVADGQLLPNIINGKFFSDKYNKINWLQPSKEDAGITLKIVKDKQGKDKEIVSEFHAPKQGKNKFQQEYFNQMNAVYYLSPAVWVKTLIDGEGFSYLAHRSRSKFKARLEKEVQGLDWKRFMEDVLKGEDKYLKSIGSKISAEQMGMINKFIKKDKTLSSLAHSFGFVARTRDKIKGIIDKRVLSKVRNAVGKVLIKGIGNTTAKALIKEWMVSGGVQTLMKGISTSIASALGVVGTPVAGVIAWVVSEVAYRVSKPLMKLGAHTLKIGIQAVLYFLVGLVSVVFLIVIYGGGVLGVHSHVSPQEITECEPAGFGISEIIDDPDYPGGYIPGDGSTPTSPSGPGSQPPGGPMNEFVAGALPEGEECLLGSGGFTCTQGPYGSFSHQNVAAIDLGGVNYFHAPAFCGNGGSCSVSYVGDVHCAGGYAGGMVKFTATYQGQTYEFKLIHVATDFSVGQTLGSGERVARVMEWSETGSACSSGKHLHLETKVNGVTVNPYDVMTKPTSEGGFGCSVSACY